MTNQYFILETGVGLVNATSYVDLNTANAYATAYGNANWTALDAGTQQNYLMQATQALDLLYGQDYYSIPLTHGSYIQALLFPRYTMVINGIQIIQSGQIPVQLVNATVEAGMMLAAGSNLYQLPSTLPFTKSESVKVGGLQTTTTYNKSPMTEKIPGYWKIEKILFPLLRVSQNPSYLSL